MDTTAMGATKARDDDHIDNTVPSGCSGRQAKFTKTYFPLVTRECFSHVVYLTVVKVSFSQTRRARGFAQPTSPYSVEVRAGVGPTGIEQFLQGLQTAAYVLFHAFYILKVLYTHERRH